MNPRISVSFAAFFFGSSSCKWFITKTVGQLGLYMFHYCKPIFVRQTHMTNKVMSPNKKINHTHPNSSTQSSLMQILGVPLTLIQIF